MSNPFSPQNLSTTGGNGTFKVWRGQVDSNGDPVYEEAEFQDYSVPTKAGIYALRVVGLGEPWEDPIPPQYLKERLEKDPNAKTTTTKTRVEFEFIDGPYLGHRVLASFLTLSLSDGKKSGNPAHLYLIYKAAVPEGGTEIGDMIGREIDVFMKPSDAKRDDGTPKYAVFSYDTCAPHEAAEAAAPTASPFQKKTAA